MLAEKALEMIRWADICITACLCKGHKLPALNDCNLPFKRSRCYLSEFPHRVKVTGWYCLLLLSLHVQTLTAYQDGGSGDVSLGGDSKVGGIQSCCQTEPRSLTRSADKTQSTKQYHSNDDNGVCAGSYRQVRWKFWHSGQGEWDILISGYMIPCMIIK